MVGIFCVGFHHKRGSQIEYSFPSVEDLFDDEHWKTEFMNKITTYALPDSVHNLNEDFMYFTFQVRVKK